MSDLQTRIPTDQWVKVPWERAHPPSEMPSEIFDYATEDATLAKLEQL